MDSPNPSTCSICHEEENIYALAPCNHHICFKCSTRLRLLHQQYYCPICRADCPLVLFVHTANNYSSYNQKTFIQAKKLKALFEDKRIENAVKHLTAHDCYVCAENGQQETFSSFKNLQLHIKKQHQLYFCDICVEFVKIFSFERKAYSRTDLAIHRRKGDANDTSFKGHPLCKLCDKRFLDTDELWRHLRKDHFFCHFCDADGSHIYFGNYPSVKDHFREAHFLCEEGDCADVEFTNAFRSEIDLIAHKAQAHPKSNKKNQQRQSRMLPVKFNYAKEYQRRPNRDKGTAEDDPGGTSQERPSYKGPQTENKNNKNVQEEIDIARGVAASLEQTTTVPNVALDVESALDFPSLNGDSTALIPKTTSSSPAPQRKDYYARASGLVMVDDNEEFPNLSSTAKTSASAPLSHDFANTTAKAPQKSSKRVAPAAVKAKSNPWNNTEDEFPTLERTKVTTSVPSWHVPKPQPKPSRPSFVAHCKPELNSTSDFPTLGSGVSSSLASIGSWIRTNSSSKVPAPAPEIASKAVDSTNPQLNYYKATPDSTTKGKKSKKKEKQASSEKKGEQSTSSGSHSTQVPSKKVKGEKLQTADKGNASTHAKSSKKTGDAQSKGSEKEVLPINDKVTSENGVNSSLKSDASKDKSCKKSDNFWNGNEKVCEPVEPGVTEAGSESGTGKDKHEGSAENGPSEPPIAVSTSRTKHNPNGGKISKKMAALEAELLDEENFPSLPLGNVNISTKNKLKWDSEDFPVLSTKVSEMPVQKTNELQDACPVSEMAQLSLDAYPLLSTSGNVHSGVSKLPPGLGVVPSTSVPPGLSGYGPLSSVNTKPPGLEVNAQLSISSVANLITGESANALGSSTYREPTSFKERNKKLFFKLKDLIHHDSDKLNRFKRFSSDFRGDAISAKEFYDGCYKLLGQDVFLEILPELLVLLPDISKQQSLYTLCKEELVDFHSARSWNVANVSLAECSICSQVLLLPDVVHHEVYHVATSSDSPAALTRPAKPNTKKAW